MKNIITLLIFLLPLSILGQGPDGYQECEPEQNFREPVNVAFGNDGTYKYLFNQIGPFIYLGGQFFGGGSGAKIDKCWYQKISEMDVEIPSAKLAKAFLQLKEHMKGNKLLSAAEIMDQDAVIQANISAIGIKKEMIAKAFDLVNTYENTIGPLFNLKDGRIMLPREPEPGKEIHYALLTIMDAITRSYSSAKLEEFPDVFKGAFFKTSEYFPGKVDPPTDPSNVFSVKVNASQTPNWGTPIFFHRDAYARRPTGTYVAPGTMVKIKVPASVINKGYTIRVGTHFWDLKYRNRIARLDRATIVYPVIKETITVGSPLGGNIYFEVPEGLDGGEISLEITGAVRSPFFSLKQSHKTTLEEWRNIERHHPGAWADFESDKFLMQVPTSWITDYDDPETMLKNYDTAMDAVSDLLGKPRLQGTHTMYRQIDVIMKASVHAPGYPMVNVTYDPKTETNGKGTQAVFLSPQFQPWVILHELGHSHFPSFFVDEVESIVNLLHVAVANDGFGMPLDSALGISIEGRYDVTLDKAAMTLMVTDPFRKNQPLNRDRMSYQHRGHAKYVNVARLFGWDVIGNMFKKINEDYNHGIVINKTHHPTDDRILRMSVEAGVDLRPLLHFWGRPPIDNQSLADSLKLAGLPASKRIYDALEHYKTIIPKNLKEGRELAKFMFPKEGHPSHSGHDLERDMAFVYDNWNESYASEVLQQIELIQGLYFPNGCPKKD